MEKRKVCSFFGHREIKIEETLIKKIEGIIENLIAEKGVSIFLFGSKSEFDSLCLYLMGGFKEKYPFIKRIAYTCKGEGCNLESLKEESERLYSKIYGRKVEILYVDEEVNFKNKWIAGKSGYVQRNYAMIDESDFCVFYYDVNVLRKDGQAKSGTKIAYEYAIKKRKQIINVAELV